MAITIEKKENAKKYVRLKAPPNFELTPRVVCINSEICRNPLIRKDQLQKKFPDIPDTVFDKIERCLFHNGFHARPEQQKKLHPAKGSLKTYLNPEPLGLQLHYAFFEDPVPVPKFTQDNNYRTWNYMRHKHNETTSLLNYQAGAEFRNDVSFYTEPELWKRFAPNDRLNKPAYNIDNYPKLMAQDFIANPPEQVGKSQPKVPLKLKTRIDWDIRLPKLEEEDNERSDANIAQPDHFLQDDLTTVTLPISVEPDGYTCHNKTTNEFFFHESDEGTETILPREFIRQSPQLFAGSSLFAKYVTYIAAYRKRAHIKQFGIPSFSVITETTTPERVDLIIKKLSPILLKAPLNIHPEFLLFVDRQTLANHFYNPYHTRIVFKNLAGKKVRLLPH